MQSLGTTKKKSSGNQIGLLIGLGVFFFILIVGVEVYKNRNSFNLGSDKPASDSSIPAAEIPQYEAFNKIVAVAFNNIGYHNIDNLGNYLSPYFQQDILYDVENSYTSQDLGQELKNGQLYCFAQDIQEVQTVVNKNQVSSWFTGMVTYSSRIKPGYLRVPFSFRLISQKFDNQFKVVKFVLLTKNPQ